LFKIEQNILPVAYKKKKSNAISERRAYPCPRGLGIGHHDHPVVEGKEKLCFVALGRSLLHPQIISICTANFQRWLVGKVLFPR
jgi:hypothetical protein